MAPPLFIVDKVFLYRRFPPDGLLFLFSLLLHQDGFTNGHFLYTSDTFDINRQGVVALRKDASLDRETKDSYTFQV